MAKYVYKGEEISHTKFLSICRKAGLQNPRKINMYDQLVALAKEGNERAKDIFFNLKVTRDFNITLNDKDGFLESRQCRHDTLEDAIQDAELYKTWAEFHYKRHLVYNIREL